MATVLEQTTFTTDQLLAMPDDGSERWLIHGELQSLYERLVGRL
jgi:hypothetical protein